MGDGKVALILDVLGLAQKAHVISGARERALDREGGQRGRARRRPPDRAARSSRDDGGRMAIPLSLVARLEEFPRSALERAGTQDVVQYRDEILPLIDVSRVLRRRRRDSLERKAGRAPEGGPPARGRRRRDGPGRRLLGRGPARRAGRRPHPRHRRGDARLPLPVQPAGGPVHGRGPGPGHGVPGHQGHHPLGRAGILRAAPARRRGGLSHGGRPSILHVLRGRPFLRAGRAEGAGDHPLPGDDLRAAGPAGGARVDQPARPDRDGHRPPPPPRAARPARRTSCP